MRSEAQHANLSYYGQIRYLIEPNLGLICMRSEAEHANLSNYGQTQKLLRICRDFCGINECPGL